MLEHAIAMLNIELWKSRWREGPNKNKNIAIPDWIIKTLWFLNSNALKITEPLH